MDMITTSDYPGDDSGADDDNTLYLVPSRWWSEAWKALFAESKYMVNGIYYSVESKKGPSSGSGESEIVLKLSKRDGQEGHYALVAEWMFLRATKRLNDVKEVGDFVSTEDNMPDMFSLMIKLSVSRSSSSLTVRIHEKDNREFFRKACSIFHVESGVLGIWDFSDQTTHFLSHEEIEFIWRIPLKLQVCGSSGGFCSSLMTNESTDHGKYLKIAPSRIDESCYLKIGKGLTGLQNMGNTCYMNSGIQCLMHTPDIVDYFLGDYRKDINTENPKGMKGELALSFGDLLRKLWVPGAKPIAPKAFKSVVTAIAPRFEGYRQEDCQEFLILMMDMLHEDLKRVKFKPHSEPKEIGSCPDNEVADDPIVVDLCQGQHQYTLVCLVCKEQSIKVEIFRPLLLPIPQTKMREISLTVFSTDGTSLPWLVTVTVPKYGNATDLLQALRIRCCLKDGETLLIAEIFDCRILQFLDNPTGSLELLRDDDELVAYKLPKEGSCLVVFMHERLQRLHSEDHTGTQSSKRFGTPLVACISNLSSGSEILEAFSRLLIPFLMPEKDKDDKYDELNSNKKFDKEDNMTNTNRDLSFDGSNSGPGFQFFFTEKSKLKRLEIKMNEPLPVPPSTEMFNLTVTWPEKVEILYDTFLLSNLKQILEQPEQPQEQLSLYKCLEATTQEVLLVGEDAWSCPNCKKKQEATKKLHFLRLPKILIIVFERFEHIENHVNKLETFIDFPVDDLDLSSYMLHDSQVSQRYQLYAVSNHYGNFSGGHYTAFARHDGGQWYEFNDDRVTPIEEGLIKTSAAYLLFYRRKEA